MVRPRTAPGREYAPLAHRARLRAPRRLIRTQLVDHPSNAFISVGARDVIDSGHVCSYNDEECRLEGLRNTPIEGQLVGVKDNICTTDFATTCGSNMLRNFVSPFDATVVEKIRAQGGIIAGKTNLDEFGMGSHSIHSAFGPVVNPKSHRGPKSAGGSSGGSAAAVSAGLCTTAVGTDTGGSVRLPAAYCGIVGFKPSYGMISRYGVVAYANSLDTVGALGQTVPDVQGLWAAMRGSDGRDPTCLSDASRERIQRVVEERNDALSGRALRIGIPVEYWSHAEEHTRSYGIQSLKSLLDRGLGKGESVEIVPVQLPTTDLALSTYYILAPAEAASNLAKYDGVRYGQASPNPRPADDVLYSQTRLDGLGDEVRRRILLGSYSLSSTAIDNYFIQAQKVRRLVQQDFNSVFSLPHPLGQAESRPDAASGSVDLLLTPTAPSGAPRLLTLEDSDPDLKKQLKLKSNDDHKKRDENSVLGALHDRMKPDHSKKESPVENDTAPDAAVASYASDVLTVPASLAGIPAISIPMFATEAPHQIPCGLQVIGQYGDDELVLDFARKWEAMLRKRAKETPLSG